MSFENRSQSKMEMSSDEESDDDETLNQLNARKKKHKKVLAQQFLAKTKYIEDELNQTPENQILNLNKLKQCQSSKRASLKAAMRKFIAGYMKKDKTFQ